MSGKEVYVFDGAIARKAIVGEPFGHLGDAYFVEFIGKGSGPKTVRGVATRYNMYEDVESLCNAIRDHVQLLERICKEYETTPQTEEA